jgi:hypothetical protein
MATGQRVNADPCREEPMRDHTALGSVQANLFPEYVRQKPGQQPARPERRTRPGRGIASCKCEQPQGEYFCGTCGKLLIPAELGS